MNDFKKTILSLTLAILIAGLVGCGEERTIRSPVANQPPSQTLDSLTDVQQKQKERAIAARDKLFKSLSGELMASMSEKGPVKSIAVCKNKAPEVAAAISEETGVRIGRTSFKLRNTDNAAPDWAAKFVTDHVENEIAVELPDNELGLLFPIRIKPTCTICHGTRDQLLPDVKAALVTHYPNDEATGFAEGDLRGYFWVEVPGDE